MSARTELLADVEAFVERQRATGATHVELTLSNDEATAVVQWAPAAAELGAIFEKPLPEDPEDRAREIKRRRDEITYQSS